MDWPKKGQIEMTSYNFIDDTEEYWFSLFEQEPFEPSSKNRKTDH